MTYKFPVTVTDVFERKTRKHISGAGENAIFSSDSAGWYVRLADNFSIYVGDEKPSFIPGQKIFLQLRES